MVQDACARRTLVVGVFFLVASRSIGAVVSRTCPVIPGDGDMKCSSLFNPSCTDVIGGDLQASWFLPVNATVHSFAYADQVGQLVHCEPPTKPIECMGVLYDPSCFQFLAVREAFGKIRAHQTPAEGFVKFDHPIEYEYTVMTDAGHTRRVSFSPSLRVVVQRDQEAQMERYLRWDYKGSVLRLTESRYVVDHFNPAKGVTALLEFWIDWPAWVRPTAVRVITAAPDTIAKSFDITRDCHNAGPKDNCTQSYALVLHAPYSRNHFRGTFDLGFTLDCRQTECPDFENGKEHPIPLKLWTSSWGPEDPWDGSFGLTNRLDIFSDPDRTIPVKQAVNWHNTYYLQYKAQSQFRILNTTLRHITIVHNRQPEGVIWDGFAVNTNLIKAKNLVVRCPPHTPLAECHFDLTFDPSDPLWKDVKEEVFLTFDIHVGGRVTYKEEGGNFAVLEQSTMYSFPFAPEPGKFAPSSGDRGGNAPLSAIKKMALGNPTSTTTEEVPGLFYAGAAFLAMGFVVLAFAYRIKRQARSKADPLLMSSAAETPSYASAGRTGPLGA